jgi:hypothetical protein
MLSAAKYLLLLEATIIPTETGSSSVPYFRSIP